MLGLSTVSTRDMVSVLSCVTQQQQRDGKAKRGIYQMGKATCSVYIYCMRFRAECLAMARVSSCCV